METFQEDDVSTCTSWHERMVFLRSVKSLVVAYAMLRAGGTGRGTDTEVLVCPAKDSGTYPQGSGHLGRVWAAD